MYKIPYGLAVRTDDKDTTRVTFLRYQLYKGEIWSIRADSDTKYKSLVVWPLELCDWMDK